MVSYHYFIFRRVFWCPADENPTPAKITSWITWSTKANFWQSPGRFTASMQLIAMIFSLENVYQWCGKTRTANNASITMKSGRKMVHFHQKYHRTSKQNTSTRSNESSSLFLPVIITSISNENCSCRGRSLHSWLWNCNKCGYISPFYGFHEFLRISPVLIKYGRTTRRGKIHEKGGDYVPPPPFGGGHPY